MKSKTPKPAKPKALSTPAGVVSAAAFRKPPVIRKYQLREDYFDRIDTPNKAYFLGFLYADGYVSKTGASIFLNDKDEHILLSFRDELYPVKDRPLYFVKKCFKQWGNKRHATYRQAGLTIFSQKMAKSLMGHGCTQKKTDTIRFPFNSLPEELYRDFIRGYFDGDGCITRSRSKYKKSVYSTWSVSFCANPGFGKDLNEALAQLGFKFYLNQYKLTIIGTGDKPTISRFFSYFWYKGCLCLDRKRRKFDCFSKELAQNQWEKWYPKSLSNKRGYVSEVAINHQRYYLGWFKEAESAFLLAQMFKEFMSE